MIRGVRVSDAGQLRAVLAAGDRPERIYLPYPVFLSQDQEMASLAAGFPEGTAFFADLAYLFREEPGMPGKEDLEKLLNSPAIRMDGVLAHNLETAAFLREKKYPGILETDQQLPVWNAGAAGVFTHLMEACRWEWTISPELSLYEIRELLDAVRDQGKTDPSRAGLVVYGRVPMMVSVNCVRMTAGSCTGQRGNFSMFSETLRDRKGRKLPVTGDCRVCYNVLLNAVPTSLHRYRKEIGALGLGRIRIDLTDEDPADVREILDRFFGQGAGDAEGRETTTGRFKKGVE